MTELIQQWKVIMMTFSANNYLKYGTKPNLSPSKDEQCILTCINHPGQQKWSAIAMASSEWDLRGTTSYLCAEMLVIVKELGLNLV